MPQLFVYLLKMIICSAVLFIYYRLALRNKIFNQYNRFYLLGTVVLSLLLPLCQLTLNHTQQSTREILSLLSTINGNSVYELETVIINPRSSNISNITIHIVAIVGILLLVKLLFGLLKLSNIIKKGTSQPIGDVEIISTTDARAPFSFFKYIFWRADTAIDSPDGQRIFRHELAHVREKHSLDKLFLSFTVSIFWMNPIFWILKNELYLIHEFIADKKAVQGEDEIPALASMLLAAYQPQQQFSITNNFFHSPIKRRLAMMTKNQKQKLSYASRLFALPLLAMLGTAIALKAGQTTTQGILGFIVPSVESARAINESPQSNSMSTENEKLSIPTENAQQELPDTPLRMVIDSPPNYKPLFRVNGIVVDKRIAYAINKSEILKTEVNGNLSKLEELGFKGYTVLFDITLKEVSEGTELELQGEKAFQSRKLEEGKNTTENGAIVQSDDDNTVFTKVEHEAEFSGGPGNFRKFLEKNLDGNIPIKNNAPAGTYTVIIKFIVSKNGKVYDVVAESKHGYGMEAAAIATIKNSPDWQPAIQNRKPVNAYRRQPITFLVPSK